MITFDRVPYTPNKILSYYDFDFLSFLSVNIYLGKWGIDALQARTMFVRPYISTREF